MNFWATWCPPCVEELPLINQFYRQQAAAGWQVLGLAVDQAGPVARFLERLPLDFPVALAGFAGTDLSRSLGNASGALPFSVVLGRDGAVLHRKLGKVSADELKLWAQLGEGAGGSAVVPMLRTELKKRLKSLHLVPVCCPPP